MQKISRNQERKKKHYRIRYKIVGTNKCPRLNVFKSLRHFEAQVVDDQKGHTLVYVSTKQLKLPYGGNLDAAQKVGQVLGEKMIKLGIKKIVFDRSGYIYHGRLKVFAEAIRNKGVVF